MGFWSKRRNLSSWRHGSYGSGTNQLYNPAGLDVDSSGNIYVSSISSQRINKWAPGATSGSLLISSVSSYGLLVDSYGNLFFSDANNRSIKKHVINPEITITAGQTTGTLTLTAVSDSSDEENETIIATPDSSPINATISASAAKTITITDDDEPPTVTFAFSSASIEENSSTDVTLTATLSVVSGKAIVIPYTVGGTATITEEYTITASPINIAAGSTTGTVTISTNGKNDTDIEIIETIKLTKCYFFIIV